MITGAAFVYLSAAYDTVNHRILIQKLYNITQDTHLYRVPQNMLSNRRFYVELNNVGARMEKAKQKTNEAHALYGQHPTERRMQFRNCFKRSLKLAE